MRTRISRTGKPNSGYTLIELIVVVVLLGLIFSFVAPRFRDAILTDQLKGSTRKLVNTLLEIRHKAIQDHQDYLLKFDLEKNEYWEESIHLTGTGRSFAREKAQKLPEGIHISDIWIHQTGKTAGGEVTLMFRKEGYAQKSAIHLKSEDGREFTIELQPFLPKIEVLEDYIEFEDS